MTDEQIEECLRKIPRGNPRKEKLIGMCKNISVCMMLWCIIYGLKNIGIIGFISSLIVFTCIEVLVEVIHKVYKKLKHKKGKGKYHGTK